MTVTEQSRLDVRKCSLSWTTITEWNTLFVDCVHYSNILEFRADDRAYWRRMGVANLERRRITMEAEKRERRKYREHDDETADSASCVCTVCSRICRSAIGFYGPRHIHRA